MGRRRDNAAARQIGAEEAAEAAAAAAARALQDLPTFLDCEFCRMPKGFYSVKFATDHKARCLRDKLAIQDEKAREQERQLQRAAVNTGKGNKRFARRGMKYQNR